MKNHTDLYREYAIIALFIVTLISSCTNNQTYENLEPRQAKNENIEFEIEDVSIAIDTITYPSYYKFQNALFNDSSYLVGFSGRMNSLDFFNLSSKEFSTHVKIDRKGPNGIDHINGFYVHNWDSIFIFSFNRLALIDSAGTVRSNYDLFELGIQDFEGDASIGVDLGFDLHYSKQRNSVFVKYVPKDVPFGSKEFYSKPFMAELSLDSLHLKTIPFEYSIYIRDNYLASMDMPHVSFDGSMIFCCFKGESNIYSFDLENGRTKEYGGRSSFSKPFAAPLDRNASREEKSKHRVESVSYLNLRYDPYRDLYYRLHFGDIKHNASDSMEDINATYLEKGLYMMIFNSKLELIKEVALEKYTYLPEFYGLSEEGIYLNANHDMNLDYDGKYAKFKLFRVTYDK